MGACGSACNIVIEISSFIPFHWNIESHCTELKGLLFLS